MNKVQARRQAARSISLVVLVGWIGTGAADAQQRIDTCSVLPANNIWNTPVDRLPVLSNSASMVTSIGANTGFHADFGAGMWNGGPIGIPFIAVSGTQTKYPATFYYAGESDQGPYTIPLNAPIEGGSSSTGDRHAIAIDTDHCIVYELYNAHPQSASWNADSGAIFDLTSNALRPATWTSADAAGLAILPGLVTYEEVLSGEINHAVRFTAPQTRHEFVWPARHYASSLTGTQYPRMGERFRLKASVDITSYPADVQVILRAMKKYGIMLADNGSAWYVSGKPDARWNDNHLHTLGQLLGSNFEAVDATVLRIDPNSGQAIQSGVADFDGDGKADRTVFRPGAGIWYSLLSGTSTAAATAWGASTDLDVAADYDGDGKADLAVWRPSTGQWFIIQSATGTVRVDYWGVSGDIPLAGDVDGDGRADLVVWRPSTSVWYAKKSAGGALTTLWGASGDTPLLADFDGDGKADFTIYRPTASSVWYVTLSGGGFQAIAWGVANDIPVAGDWDGDGKADAGIFRSSTGQWFIKKSSGGILGVTWGAAGDTPLAGDADGDGKSDFILWRSSTGVWYTQFVTGGTAVVGWGTAGDRPVGRVPGS